jgi:hypothetical protein
LSQIELNGGGQTGQASWISKGLKIEESQYVPIKHCNLKANRKIRFELRSHVRKLGRKPSTAQKLDLANKRRKLRNRITAFSNMAVEYLGEDATDSIYHIEQLVLDEEVSEDDLPEQNTPTMTVAHPERQVLPFPSAVPDDFLADRDLPEERRGLFSELKQTELEIREGHGDDALEHVRTAVIHLSWEFKNTVRRALTGAEKARAWDKAKLFTRVWKLHRRVYNHNRIVMMALGDRITVSDKFPVLEKRDCDASTAVSNPNQPGQSTDRLPWFWSSSARVAASAVPDSEHENECNVPSFHPN